jgi:hypothetical protein
MLRAAETVDDFTDVGGWTPIASGQAQLTIARDRGPAGAALRLDFDFKGGAGFVVATKRYALTLPDAYVFTLDVRGAAPANAFELKLVDPSGHNVWRYRKESFAFASEWRSLRIRSSEIDFAWGPAGSGPAGDVGAIEIAIVAPPGGAGTVWIANLCLEDASLPSLPATAASSVLSGHESRCAVDRSPRTSWRSARSDDQQWLAIDLGAPREYGGLIVGWDPATPPRAFDVETSDDGNAWTVLQSAARPGAGRSYIYLGRTESRWLRIHLHAGDDGNGVGIAKLDVRPYDVCRSLNEFLANVAANEPHGLFPRYLGGKQSYWTSVGSARGGLTQGLLNEDGMLEVDRGSFSLEPFVYVGGRLLSWADGSPEQELERGFLPIPSSVWRTDGLVLGTTAFATDAVLFVRYRVENRSVDRRDVRLFVAVRPFQVTPPWQAYGELGGVTRIGTLEREGDTVWVDRRKAVIALTPPDAFGAAPFEDGAITEYLVTGDLPRANALSDPSGHASGALRYDIELAAGGARDIYLAAPFGTLDPSARVATRRLDGAAALDVAIREWSAKLGRVTFRLPATAVAFADTFRTAAAHILVNRAGPALQPGPRRYARSWIRDGATMGAALLRAGCVAEVSDKIRWYAGYQAADGTVPAIVDSSGPDPLAEYDSQGELIYAVMEYVRFTGDRAFAAELWPVVARSVDRIEALRSQRLTADFRTPEKRACYGLLPESVSHEGYLAHPVHSYWDDFWALRGLADAAHIAQILGDAPGVERLTRLRDDFRETLRASIVATMADRGVEYVPASVEWADIDPAATANAIGMLDLADVLPSAAVARTFDEYLADFRKRRSGETDWSKYSPYEIRIISALIRLERREDAFELARFFLADRRPLAWNQWPEIAWRDPRSPGHLGDLPHTWIAAEFMLAFRTMLAFEREADDALIVGAGIPAEWLESGGTVEVADLPTWYGPLTFTIARDGDAVNVDVALGGDVAKPGGGIVIRPPVERPLRAVVVNGAPSGRFTATEATVAEVPAKVRLTW